ncbi:hypothetical protein [Cnuella takakiae]|nr:hypothetical protein [Cnuella takakiae]
MTIELPRNMRPSALDSFISQYNLEELQLRSLIRSGETEALRQLGWQLERNNAAGILLSKIMAPFRGWGKADERIRFTEHQPTFAERFPAVNNGLLYGYNRFRNKQPFAVLPDSSVRFFFRGHQNSRQVKLAGSFNDWDPDALSMVRTDSGWIADVKLAPGKYWYKFIADGHWMVDNDNLVKENDGEGNTNSIYFRPNTTIQVKDFAGAKNIFVAGSFNNWRNGELELQPATAGRQLSFYLAAGTHTYKLVVDGQMLTDPANPNRLPDGKDGYNSVVALGKPRTFVLEGFAAAQKVVLTGSFNAWRNFELPMRKTARGWEISYVLGPGNYTYRFEVDGKAIADPANPPHQQDAPSLLVIDPNHTFRLKGYAGAQQVYLAGDVNKWNSNSLPMQKDGEDWVLPMHLWVGKHRYKFIVDGKWILDPANKLWENNEFDTGNSILWVGK